MNNVDTRDIENNKDITSKFSNYTAGIKNIAANLATCAIFEALQDLKKLFIDH